MPSRTRSMASLEVVLKEGVGGSLRLHSSLPITTPSGSFSRPMKRKLSDLAPHPSGDTSDSRSPKKSAKMAQQLSQKIPQPVYIPSLQPSCATQPPEPEESGDELNAPPSPAPTLCCINSSEDYEKITLSGRVKTHDYAYGPPDSATLRPQPLGLWTDPLMTLLIHDIHVRQPDEARYGLYGSELRRLLDSGLVTDEEAQRNWTEVDWERLRDHDEGRAAGMSYLTLWKLPARPSAAFRERVRNLLYGFRPTMKIDVFVPADPVGEEMWEGNARVEKWLSGVEEQIKAGKYNFEPRLREWCAPKGTKARVAIDPRRAPTVCISDKPFIPASPSGGSSTELPVTEPNSPDGGALPAAPPTLVDDDAFGFDMDLDMNPLEDDAIPTPEATPPTHAAQLPPAPHVQAPAIQPPVQPTRPPTARPTAQSTQPPAIQPVQPPLVVQPAQLTDVQLIHPPPAETQALSTQLQATQPPVQPAQPPTVQPAQPPAAQPQPAAQHAPRPLCRKETYVRIG